MKAVVNSKILFYGIGNPGRQDDGLGIEFIENFRSTHKNDQNFFFESNYQLNIEDALFISEYEMVIFIDANRSPLAQAPFEIKPLKATKEITFSTHAMSMSSVLGFCQELYHKNPKAYVLSIPGYDWDLKEGLSAQAQVNLQKSLMGLHDWIKEYYA